MSNIGQFWYTNFHTEDVGTTCKMSKILHSEKTEFQDLALVETNQFGRTLVLDGVLQTSIMDEFIYHEMITHVPLFALPNPQKAMVIGGGDGGAIREILKHPTIEKVNLVEIDKKVIEVSKKYLPEISCALDDSRVEIKITDGLKYIRNQNIKFDFIIIDSTDPICFDEGFFETNFFKKVYDALNDDGIFVAPTNSPFFHPELITKVYNDISSVFPITRLYTCPIPTYPSGYWTFTIGSKKHDPLKTDISKIPNIDTRFYTPQMQQSAFVLPKFVAKLIEKKRE